MTDKELMQEALYALTYVGDAKEIYSDTIESLRARLAQPEQRSEQWWKHEVSNAWAQGYEKGRLQREWQGLTDEEMMMIYGQSHEGKKYSLGRAIEAKLKEKNSG
jgi:hypothetical protein